MLRKRNMHQVFSFFYSFRTINSCTYFRYDCGSNISHNGWFLRILGVRREFSCSSNSKLSVWNVSTVFNPYTPIVSWYSPHTQTNNNFTFQQIPSDSQMSDGYNDFYNIRSELLGSFQPGLALHVKNTWSEKTLVLGKILQSHLCRRYYCNCYCIPQYWKFDGLGKNKFIIINLTTLFYTHCTVNPKNNVVVVEILVMYQKKVYIFPLLFLDEICLVQASTTQTVMLVLLRSGSAGHYALVKLQAHRSCQLYVSEWPTQRQCHRSLRLKALSSEALELLWI